MEGYKSNPYDPWVTNKIIKNKRMKTCFHVNDWKLSHKIPKVIENKFEWIRQEYESIFEDGSEAMSVSRDKIHKYHGTTMDSTVSGIERISMLEYIH